LVWLSPVRQTKSTEVQIDGTGSRRKVLRVNVVEFDIVGCLAEI